MLFRWSVIRLASRKAAAQSAAPIAADASLVTKALTELAQTRPTFECFADVQASMKARGIVLEDDQATARTQLLRHGVSLRLGGPASAKRAKELADAIAQQKVRSVAEARRWWSEAYRREVDATLVDLDLLGAGYYQEEADFSLAQPKSSTDEELLGIARSVYEAQTAEAAAGTPSQRIRTVSSALASKKKKKAGRGKKAGTTTLAQEEEQVYDALRAMGVTFRLAMDEMAASLVMDQAKASWLEAEEHSSETTVAAAAVIVDKDALQRWLSPSLTLEPAITFSSPPTTPPRVEALQTPEAFFMKATQESNHSGVHTPKNQFAPPPTHAASKPLATSSTSAPVPKPVYNWQDDKWVTRALDVAASHQVTLSITNTTSSSGRTVTTVVRSDATGQALSVAVSHAVPSTSVRMAVSRALHPTAFPLRPPPDLTGGTGSTIVDELLEVAVDAALCAGQLPQWSVSLVRETNSKSTDHVRVVANAVGAPVLNWVGTVSGAAFRAAVAIANAHAALVAEADQDRYTVLIKEAVATMTEFNGKVQPIPALQTALQRTFGAEIETSAEEVVVEKRLIGFRGAALLRGFVTLMPDNLVVKRLQIGAGVSLTKKGAIREASIDALLQTLSDEDRARVQEHPAFEKEPSPPAAILAQLNASSVPIAVESALPTATDNDAVNAVVPPVGTMTELFVARGTSALDSGDASFYDRLQKLSRARDRLVFEDQQRVSPKLWRTTLYMATASSAKAGVIAVGHHADPSGATRVAALKALASLFPEEFAKTKMQLPSDAVDSLSSPSAATSELARLRRAVRSAAVDAYSDDIDFREEESTSGDKYVTQLHVGNDVIAEGVAETRLRATLLAYRAAFALPLLHDEPQRWSANQVVPIDVSIPAAADLSTRRQAALAGHDAPAWDVDGSLSDNVRLAVSHLYGFRLLSTTEAQGDDILASLYALSAPNAAPVFIVAYKSVTADDARLNAFHQALMLLAPELEASLFAAVSVKRALLPTHKSDVNAYVDGALRLLMVRDRQRSPRDVDVSLQVSPYEPVRAVATVTLPGVTSGTAATKAQRGPCTAIRAAFDAALAGVSESVWLEGQRLRGAVELSSTFKAACQQGPVVFATFLVARHHGLQLAFCVSREPVKAQSVWRATVVLCADSRDLEVLPRAKTHEIVMPDDVDATPAVSASSTDDATARVDRLDGNATQGVRVGEDTWADGKKPSILKAVLRFLEANFPRETAAARATHPGQYPTLPQSAAEEKRQLCVLQRRDRRQLAAIPSAVSVAKKVQKFHATWLDSDDAANLDFYEEIRPTTVVKSPRATTTQKPTSGSLHSTAPSQRTLLDVLKDAGAAQQLEIRVSTTHMAGGWVSTVSALPRTAEGALNFQGERSLATSTSASKQTAKNLSVYLAMQDHFSQDLFRAIEADPSIVDVDSLSV